MRRTAFLTMVALLAGCTSPRPVVLPAPAASASPAALPIVLPSPMPLPSLSGTLPIGPFHNVDVVLPSWPAKSTRCVSGRIHLGAVAQYVPQKAGKSVINVMSAVPVDFDGDGTDEYAAYILCGEGPEAGGRMVVGFRRVDGVFRSIGRIVGTQDGIQMMELMRPKGNAIEVLVSAEYSDGGQRFVPSQWRTYALRGSGFRQIGGEVTFPADPPAIRLTVQPRQVVLRKAGEVRTGTVQFTLTNAGNLATPAVGVRIALPESFQPAGSDWSGCAVEIPGVYVCRLPGLEAGGTLDRSMEVLAPVEPAPAAELGVAVYSDSAEYDLSTQESVPLAILYP